MPKSKFDFDSEPSDFDKTMGKDISRRHAPLRAPVFEPQPKGKLELKADTWLVGQRPGLRPREE